MDGTIVNVAIYLTATFAAALVTGVGICIRIGRRRRLAVHPHAAADRNVDHRLWSGGAEHLSLEIAARRPDHVRVTVGVVLALYSVYSLARPAMKHARFICAKGAVASFLAAVVAFVIVSKGSAEQGPDEVNVQGGWAYTARGQDGVLEQVATTRAAEDAVWFLLACRADGRLTVSFIHSERFPFPLKPVFLVKLRSNNVPTALIEAKSVENNQIFVAPLLMRHIMPLLMQDHELVISIPERDGDARLYVFDAAK